MTGINPISQATFTFTRKDNGNKVFITLQRAGGEVTAAVGTQPLGQEATAPISIDYDVVRLTIKNILNYATDYDVSLSRSFCMV